jgi:hypothetical protein
MARWFPFAADARLRCAKPDGIAKMMAGGGKGQDDRSSAVGR